MSAEQKNPNGGPGEPPLYGITWITDWLLANNGANAQTVVRAQALEGGWESWLQVVLSLNGPPPNLPPGYTLLREQHALQDPKLIVDVYMKRPPGSQAPNFGIELKCRTAAETKTSFVNRLKVDMEKIQDGTVTGTGRTDLYAVGITRDKNDLLGYADVTGKVYYWAVPDGEGAGNFIYVIWLRLKFDV